MTLAFIGIGNVGFAIANNLQKKGHDIIIAHDDSTSESVRKARAQNPNFAQKSIQAAVDAADVVVSSIPFKANEETLKDIHFHGKTLIDCTNPVGAGMSHGLKSEISGSEKVQEWAASAKVVKAFSIYGFENLANSIFENYNVKPVMMIAGNNADAKAQVGQICTDLGFETLDTGKLDQALHLEHLTLLWVKMARRDKHHPNFAWAYLEKS
jgi:8-hydroxy-5-deazaflavin:NADPH oxidoreductase